MKLSSPAFLYGETIPKKYGQNYENINPPLIIDGVPAPVVSFVLIMEDPDVPSAAGVPIWDHWVAFNISADVKEIPEAWVPTGVRGVGTRGLLDYSGPRPPDREHRYFFRLYALDAMLNIPEGSSKSQVLQAAESHVLETAELMGRFAPSV